MSIVEIEQLASRPLEDLVRTDPLGPQDIDLAAVVQPMPLPVDGAVVADAQAERGRVLGSAAGGLWLVGRGLRARPASRRPE